MFCRTGESDRLSTLVCNDSWRNGDVRPSTPPKYGSPPECSSTDHRRQNDEYAKRREKPSHLMSQPPLPPHLNGFKRKRGEIHVSSKSFPLSCPSTSVDPDRDEDCRRGSPDGTRIRGSEGTTGPPDPPRWDPGRVPSVETESRATDVPPLPQGLETVKVPCVHRFLKQHGQSSCRGSLRLLWSVLVT